MKKEIKGTNREFEFNDELGDFQVFIDEGEPNPLWQGTRAEPYEAVKCEDCDCWIYIGKDKKELRAVEHMEKNHKEILEQHEIGRPYMFYNSVAVEAI